MKKISVFLLGIISFFIGINVSALSLVNDSVDIYALPVSYKDKISIPDNLKQSYKIEIEGAIGTPKFYTNYTSSVEISEDGVVTSVKTTWYCKGNICTTTKTEGYTSSYEQYDFADNIIITVIVDGKELQQKVNLINYAVTYSQEYMNNYLKENIKDNMTDYEKMEVITKFVASYPYSATSTSYVGFILGAGGDCIASANTIIYMARQLGITAHLRYAVHDTGAGNNHHNVAAILDGKLYIIEAGYNVSTPRYYEITETNEGLSYSYYAGFYQYDGYAEVLNIPALKYTSGELVDFQIGTMLLYYGKHSGTKVHTVNIPKNATTISGGAFSGLDTLKNIKIDTDNPNYKVVDNVLFSKDGETLISYPAGKVNSTYEISSGVKIIDEFSFIISSNLKEVIIPNTVTIIGKRAFMGGQLSKVTIGAGVETIGDEAFYNNKIINEIIIPSSVKKIGNQAFNINDKLSSIIIYSKDVELGNLFVPRNTTIIGYKNSTSEAYATKNGNKFIAISDENVKTITSDMISGLVDSIEYDGVNKLNIVIKDNNYTLIENKDYTLEYKNNTNSGKASVIITGMGNYIGYYNFSYTIKPKKIEYTIKSTTIKYLSDLDIKTNIPDDVDYNISYGNPNNSDYLYSYIPYKNIGEYQLRINISAPNYERVDEIINIKIEPLNVNDLRTSLDSSTPTYKYTGNEATPSIYLYNNNSSLTKDKDYKIEYLNNINAGEASIKITGIGNYTGTLIKTFKILPASVNSFKIEGLTRNYNYTGKKITQNIKITFNNKELVKDKDYVVTYKNNISVGTSTMTITGKGNYEGEYSYIFYINPISINNFEFSKIENYIYTGSEIKPVVNINNNSLKEGIDYTVSYRNNIYIGTASIIVTGINNYTGSVTLTFKITGLEINNCEINNLDDQVYTGKNITPNVIVKDGNTTLVENIDYKLSYINNKNVGTASILIYGSGRYSGYITKTFKIVVNFPKDLVASKQDKSSITVKWNKPIGSITGYELYYSTKKDTGYKKITTTTKTSYKKTGLSAGKTYYFKIRSYKTISGKKYYSSYTDVVSMSTSPATPTIKLSSNTSSVKVSWKKVSGATGYEVYQSADKKKYTKVGTTSDLSLMINNLSSAKTYYYKVRAIKNINNKNINGSYSKVVSVTTKPLAPNVSVSTNTNSATIKWNKVSGASGYEIYQSTNGKKYTKIKTITKGSTTSYKKTKLASSKVYYYKVRAYKTVSGKKVYSAYTVIHTATLPTTLSIKLSTKNNSIKSTWKKINCSGYEVYISEQKDGEYSLISDISNSKILSITKDELDSGKTYYIKARAYKIVSNTKKYSSYSKIVSIKVK